MRSFSKYLFATLVMVYVLTAVGLPVYLHYCGDQVEEVSYLIETNGCCEGEEPDGDCCRNEGLVLLNDADFTLKSFDNHVIQPEAVISFLSKQFTFERVSEKTQIVSCDKPVPWQHSLLAEITVMRI